MANLEEYLQAILDKIADGTETTLPSPSWNHEKYLAAIYDALGETVPAVESTDKGKFLHANESTGALEWAEGGSGGGGVLVASMNLETMTLNKTWQEIHDAVLNGGAVLQIDAMGIAAQLSAVENTNNGTYIVSAVTDKILKLSTDSANGYPSLQS